MFTRKTIIVSDGKYKYVVFLKTLNNIFNKEIEKKRPYYVSAGAFMEFKHIFVYSIGAFL